MDRRKFIAGTMLAAAGAWLQPMPAGLGRIMPNAVADEPARTGMHKFSKLRTITLEEHYVSLL